jgi:hypothetical protein
VWIWNDRDPCGPIPLHVRGRQFDQALGWEAFPEDRTVLKDGETAGFTSILVRNKSKDLAVFAVANKSSVPIDRIGRTLAQNIR